MFFGSILSTTLRETGAAIAQRWAVFLAFAVLYQITSLPVDLRLREALIRIKEGGEPSGSTFSVIPPPYDLLLAGLVDFFWLGVLLHVAREAAQGIPSKLVFDRAMASIQIKIYLTVFVFGSVASGVLVGSVTGGIAAGLGGSVSAFFVLVLLAPAALFLGLCYLAARCLCAPALIASGLSIKDAFSESARRTAVDRTSMLGCVCLFGLAFVALSYVSKTLPPFAGAMLWTHGSSLLGLACAVLSGVSCRLLGPPGPPPRRVMDILAQGRP